MKTILKEKQLKTIYSNLSPWQRVQIARHPNRPHCLDYVKYIFENFISLSGDNVIIEKRDFK